MQKKINVFNLLRSFAIAFIFGLGVITLNVVTTLPVYAGDNYSAQTDTYQETRNPNRVDTTSEELANSKLNEPEEKGKSIYENLIDKVDRQKQSALQNEPSKDLR